MSTYGERNNGNENVNGAELNLNLACAEWQWLASNSRSTQTSRRTSSYGVDGGAAPAMLSSDSSANGEAAQGLWDSLRWKPTYTTEQILQGKTL